MHVLMREARSAPIREAKPPADARYDVVAGVWRDAGGLLADRPGQDRFTKKHDIETGEDQKGQ